MNKIKTIGLLIILNAIMFQAQAQTIADVANGLIPQVKSYLSVLEIVAYLGGIVFGIKSALTLKEVNESKGQVKFSKAIFYFICAGLLIGLPTFITTGIDSLGYNQAAQQPFRY